MARSMHLSFPSQHRQTIIEVLREDEAVGLLYIFQGQMLDVTARESDAVDICRIEFALEGRRVSHALKQLRRVGLGERFGDIDVVPINCSTYKVPRRKGTGLCRSFGERMPSLEIHTSVVSSSHLTSEHTILALLASAMAASGLLTDNLVLILASFFISPLLSMIMAFTWGLCIGDGALALRGLRNMGAGCLLCFASGALIALMCSLEPNTEGISSPIASGPGIYYGISINSDQITSRGPPASTNVVTAAIIGSIAGVAVALGQSSGIASALAGVTISASLLPPMVNCGLMTVFSIFYPHLETDQGYTLFDIGCVSLALYATTTLCIIIFAFLTFKLKRIGGETLREVRGDREEPHPEYETLEGTRATFSRAIGPVLARWRPRAAAPEAAPLSEALLEQRAERAPEETVASTQSSWSVELRNSTDGNARIGIGLEEGAEARDTEPPGLDTK